jgi:hypothetical protein
LRPGDPTDLSFPTVDTGALRSVSNWLSTVSMEFLVDHLQFDSTVGMVDQGHGGWKGAARDAWDTAGQQGSRDLNTTYTGLEDASQALSTLADSVDAAKMRYDAAYSLMRQAQAAQQAAQQQAQQGQTPATLPPFDVATYRNQVIQAQTDAFDAGTTASTAIMNAAGLAAGLGQFAGGDPIRPPDLGQYPPDATYFVLLFGSVTNEGPQWQQFQEAVLKALGLKPNTQNFKVQITKQLGTRPESVDGNQVTEVKMVQYQDLDDQMLAEIQLADEMGVPYVLVVAQGTKVSAPLQQAIANARFGGEVVRMNPDGTFTDLAGNPVVKSDLGGFQYSGDPPADAGQGAGTLNHPTGIQNDEVVDPNLAPEGGDPAVPDVPDPNLPDVPDIPDIIP